MEFGFDYDVLAILARHRTGWADALTRGLMDVGMSPLAYLAAFVLCVLFAWLCQAWHVAVAAVVSSIVSVSLAEAGKTLIGRPRPPANLALVDTSGLAMPSSIGAMTLGAAMPVIIFALRSATRGGRLLAGALSIAVGVVGVSLVYLGAHWVTDVLAGWALGGVFGTAALFVAAWLDRLRLSVFR